MQDQRINRAHVKASTFYSVTYAPWKAGIQTNYGWLSKQNNHQQYIQVDLEANTRVKGVSTQGRQNANQWVTKYKLSYGSVPSKMVYYRIGRTPQVRVLPFKVTWTPSDESERQTRNLLYQSVI